MGKLGSLALVSLREGRKTCNQQPRAVKLTT